MHCNPVLLDANGDLTNDGGTGFTYDVENRLVAASGTRTAALRYDPLGRLYDVAGSNGNTRFVWDGDALIGEYNAAGTLLRRYVHGADAKADDPVAWYEGSTMSGASERILRPDWQGSIALATDRTGANARALNTLLNDWCTRQGCNKINVSKGWVGKPARNQPRISAVSRNGWLTSRHRILGQKQKPLQGLAPLAAVRLID